MRVTVALLKCCSIARSATVAEAASHTQHSLKITNQSESTAEMGWWPFGEKAGEAAISRSGMRDAMNRLRSIMIRSGMLEDDVEMGPSSTGDPYQDKVNLLIKTVQTVRDMIVERNTNQRTSMGSAADLAADSHEINKRLKELQEELDALKAMLAGYDAELAKVNLKNEKSKKESENGVGKKDDLVLSLERSQKERNTSYTNCSNALEALRELNSQRMMSEKEADGHSAVGGAPKGFRTSIDRLKAKRRNNHISAAADDGTGGGDSNLATNTETAAEFKALKEKQRVQDESLKQLGSVLAEITDGAKKIGQELDKQNAMLEQSSSTVDKLSNKLTDINNGLTKLLKETSPMSMSLYVVGCLLVMAIVGFFIFQFGGV